MAENAPIFYVYGEFDRGALGQVRRETYGEDLGQFSWITADEFREFFRQLELTAEHHVLDVACGSGGPALFLAHTVGCRVTGVDINESGVANARRLAEKSSLTNRARFEHIDARKLLPFADGSFDAIISIDAMNHFPNRAEVLREWHRLLRAGGCFLFTDAVIVTGTLSRDEILDRSSSMGLFLFTPEGTHEKLIQAAGFVEIVVEDVTETIAAVSRRWHDARARHREELLRSETVADFETLQTMLAAAHKLSEERRLSRFAYRARKPG